MLTADNLSGFHRSLTELMFKDKVSSSLCLAGRPFP